MRAVRLDTTGAIALDPSTPEPSAEPGWAVLRVLAASYTATDLDAARGLWAPEEGVVTLGRQCVGEVESSSPATDAEKAHLKAIGDSRVVPAVHAVNPESEVVRAGLPAHDPDRRTLGLSLDGTLAERVAVPIMNLHPVPEAVPTESAVLAEAVGSAVHASTQLHLERKSFITVLGDGRQALMCAQAMTLLNASVRVVGLHEAKLAVCEKLGVKHRHLDDVGRRQDQDVVVDCTGTARGFNAAVAMTRPRGKVLLRSILPVDRAEPADLAAVVDREIEVIGSRDGSVAEGLLALEDGRVRTAPMVTARCRLDDAAADLARAAEAAEDAARLVTLVEP